MDKIYHDCFYKNADGTNKVIAAGELCLTPTKKCFWKDPSNVKDEVKTRSRANSEPTVSFQTVDEYWKGKSDKTIDFYVNK